MSVSSILTSLKTEVSTILGADWSELKHVYNLEDNSFRVSDKNYGVGALSGSSVSGTTKAVTVDFDFFVVLVENFINRDGDANERAALSDIYDKLDDINDSIFQKKLNNANVLVVQDLSFDAPEKIDRGTIAVRVNFTIKYRQQTT